MPPSRCIRRQDDDRKRSKEAGFDGHLVKPVVLGELTALLEESLR